MVIDFDQIMGLSERRALIFWAKARTPGPAALLQRPLPNGLEAGNLEPQQEAAANNATLMEEVCHVFLATGPIGSPS